MLEVEVKYRAPDWDRLRERLRELGAAPGGSREDADHYFSAPDRDFRLTGEALRLRRIADKNYFTYKGPRRDAATKTRLEVELPLEAGSQTAATAVRWLTCLGYRPVAVVTKTRHVYHLQRGAFRAEVCLDDVGAVGRFAEVEVLAAEKDADAAREAVLALAAELGLTEKEPRSYLQMLLEL